MFENREGIRIRKAGHDKITGRGRAEVVWRRAGAGAHLERGKPRIQYISIVRCP